MIEQKTITFYEESYWTTVACSCCDESDEWIAWNTDPEEHPVNGSCHSREECYISALEYFGYPIREMTQEDCWEWTEDELESIAREWGVVLDFVSHD